MRTFTVVLSPDPNAGGYSVSVPAVPGALSEGDTRNEALANIREALEGVLAVMEADGQAALLETPELIAAEVALVLSLRAEEGWDMLVETAVVNLEHALVA
ncbi:MAG TPA: type II toxin-antitoxin system HicB family antitoxin [Tepidiformaceae bacterium]|nr:type II toxin-antitoxin system HicB family antitoxin [Tepidiformaceae bacterium]